MLGIILTKLKGNFKLCEELEVLNEHPNCDIHSGFSSSNIFKVKQEERSPKIKRSLLVLWQAGEKVVYEDDICPEEQIHVNHFLCALKDIC